MTNPKIINGINPEMITYLEASSNYTILNFQTGKKLISSYTLSIFESLLRNQTFIRVNRSNLINKSFVLGISEQEEGTYIRIKNNIEFLIPRRRKAVLFDKYPNLSNLSINA